MSDGLRGDKQCPHGHTARRKCIDCDREDSYAEIDRLRAALEPLRDACTDIYKDFSADDIKTQPRSIQFAWEVGRQHEALHEKEGQ